MISSSPLDQLVQDGLALGPQLLLQCVFNPYYDVLDGVRPEPLTAAERHALAAYQLHCQQALKTLYERLQCLPADRVSIHTPHTIFTVVSREYLVSDELTIIRCKCHGGNPLQLLPA
ncbi:hypothetical protein [Hymenobacter volaticus]|uniref:Uncharacterized protein n=1 Tax=Hymenobacter volaticus TaxID=2932254 RepID=A0ABY4GFF6_9BACT|nr:hypothetical protein [Hymenobacter volaticus]UOQ69670.1 hypothetical protein MUN86_29025 [Hymenobacter volaticus]